MESLMDVATWVVAHPIESGILAVLGLAGLALAFLLARLAWRAATWLFRRYVSPRPVEDVLTIVAASIATAVSAQGMWLFTGDVLHLSGPLRLLLFAFIEIAVVTSAVRARRNMRENFSAGVDGIAVWGLTVLTAVLSSLHPSSFPEKVFRLAAPLVAAWLWERGMAIERRRIRGTGRINWRLTPERIAVRFGLAETRDRTAQEVDAHRRLTRVALAAKKAKRLREQGAPERKIRAALARLDKAMDQAVEHTGLAVDKARQQTLLKQIAALYNTAALTDAEPNAPWESAMPQTPVPQDVIRAITDSAYALGRAEARREFSAPAGGWSPTSPGGPAASHRAIGSVETSGQADCADRLPALEAGDGSGAVPGRETKQNGRSSPTPARDETETRPAPRPKPRRDGDGSRPRTKTQPKPKTETSRRRWPQPADVDDLMPLAREVAADFAKAGANLTRDGLVLAFRERGQGIGTAKAKLVLDRLAAGDETAFVSETSAETNVTRDGDETETNTPSGSRRDEDDPQRGDTLVSPRRIRRDGAAA